MPYSSLLPNNILIYGYTIIYLSITWLLGTCFSLFSYFARHSHEHPCTGFCYGHIFSFLLSCMVTKFKPLRNCQTIRSVLLYYFTFPLELYKGSNFSTSLPTFFTISVFFCLFFFFLVALLKSESVSLSVVYDSL